MSASAAAKSFHATGPEQAGRCWNGEANWLSNCASSGNSGSPVPRGASRLALEAVQAVDDVDGVVGAALLAVVDDVDAGIGLLCDHIGDGLATAASSAAWLAGFLSASRSSTTLAGRGRLPVWVVRILAVLRRIVSLLICRTHLSRSAARPLDSAAPVGADLAHCMTRRRAARTDEDADPPGEAIMSTGKRRTAAARASTTIRTPSPATACSIAARCSARARVRRRDGRRGASLTGAAAEPLADDPWSLRDRRRHAAATDAVEVREERGAHAEQSQERAAQPARAHAAPSAQRHDHAERPALHHRHTGIPDIDPDKHRLVIHGLVKQPLVFTLEDAGALSDGVAHGSSSNAAATARRCSPRSRCRPTCRRSTASSPAPNGPACCSRRCSKRPASTRRRSG